MYRVNDTSYSLLLLLLDYYTITIKRWHHLIYTRLLTIYPLTYTKYKVYVMGQNVMSNLSRKYTFCVSVLSPELKETGRWNDPRPTSAVQFLYSANELDEGQYTIFRGVYLIFIDISKFRCTYHTKKTKPIVILIKCY